MLDLAEYQAIDKAIEVVLADYPTADGNTMVVLPARIDVFWGGRMVASYNIGTGQYVPGGQHDL